MEYNKNKNHILLRLENGDEIMNSITKIAVKENINLASITGIGAVNNVEIGLFDFKSKQYKKDRLDGEYELTSLLGNISMKDRKQFVHIHVNISDQNYKVFGGHLFSANITATGEIIIKVLETNVNRKYDENIGLYLWDLSSCK